MSSFVLAESEEPLSELVHDLRQPLSTIEYSACYLQMILDHAGEPVQEHLRIIIEQAELAARLMSEAATRLPRRGVQRAAAESLDRTKSHTAAVT